MYAMTQSFVLTAVWCRCKNRCDITSWSRRPHVTRGIKGGCKPATLQPLQDSVMLAKPEEAAALRAHRSALSTKHLPTRDGNGFRRLILLLTASGVSQM
jgi:hypothetical protein